MQSIDVDEEVAVAVVKNKHERGSVVLLIPIVYATTTREVRGLGYRL